MHGELVPIAFFAMLGLVLGLFYYFRYLGRLQTQRTVRTALEKGQDLSPELLDRLAEPRKSPYSDLRRGIIAIGLAIGLALFGFVLGEEDAVRPLLAAATLPLLIGIAYVILWRMDKSNQDS